MADSDAACAACGRKEGALLRCARCKTVWYCGAGCQRASWGEHKKACRLPPAPPPAHAPDVPAPPVAAPDVPGALSGGDVLAIGTSTPCRLLMLEPASGEVRFDDELSEGPLKITASPDGRVFEGVAKS
ncbi:hypothetical protein T484DRAFT_1815136 [Baffinella frigidus]|nr:hypothetical protein T484DRAFT_1815136 [Cryptophyta sp. CCMP2293]